MYDGLEYKIKLPRKAKAIWIAALRDPARKQVKELLQTKDGQCCLGVACELIGFGMTGPGNDGTYHSISCSQVWEPGRADFEEEVAAALFQTPIDGHVRPVQALMKMNDAYDQTFPQIADWIEAHL